MRALRFVVLVGSMVLVVPAAVVAFGIIWFLTYRKGHITE